MTRARPWLLIPLMAATCTWAGPAVFWASGPAAPGEAVLVAGSGLSEARAVELARLANWRPGTRVKSGVEFPSRCERLGVVQPSDVSVKFALPRSIGRGVYALRVVTDAGKSNALLLNRPDVMWIQGDAGTGATPGGHIRAFGRCLALLRGTTRFLLKGPRTLTLKAEADAYAARAALPKSLPAGDYEVRVHNGYGSSAAWSQPRRVAIAPRRPWPAKVYNVAHFGAKGRGETDDTLAIRSAIEAAGKAGGGVVYFPRGRYKLSDALTMPRLVVLRGEARELTVLFWPDTEAPPAALVQGTNSFGIEDLSIHCGNHGHVVVGDLGDKPDAGNVFLRRVLVRADMYRGHLTQEQVAQRFKKALGSSSGGGDTVRLGGRNIEITDCDLYGSGRVLFLSKTRGGRVAGNRLYNGRWGWYCISGSDGLVFENNTLQGADLMSTGGGLNCLDGSTCSQNTYFAHNSLRLFHGWDREAMTSDAGGGAYFGKVASSKGASLVLAEEPKWGGRTWAGAAVFILGGKGAGQYRRITATDRRTVELEAPWAVAPDATSSVSITMLQRNYLIVGNTFEDATVAIQFYGISIHHIIAGNTSARAGGFHNIGMWYHGYQPSWFCQLLDNRVLEGNGNVGPLNQFPPLDSHVASMGFTRAPCKDPLNRFSVLRRNQLLNNARVELKGVLADALVEGNRIENTDVGISVDGGVSGAWLRGNTFRNVRQPFNGGGIRNANIHPAELLRARLQGARAALLSEFGKAPDWSDTEGRLEQLARLRADDPSVARQCAACYPEVIAAIPLDLPLEVKKLSDVAIAEFGTTARWPEVQGYLATHTASLALQTLLGLHVAVSPRSSIHSVLQSGGGGPAELILELATADGVPRIGVSAQLLCPKAWSSRESQRETLEAGARDTLSMPLSIPVGTWGARSALALVRVAMPDFSLPCLVPLRVGSGFVREWSVIGPFPNIDKAPLDNAMHPPEEQLTLKGEYGGLGGKVRWRPAKLAANRLDFAIPFKTAENAVAFAAACLAAKRPMEATLDVQYAEGIRLWLNGEEILASAAPERKIARKDLAIELKKGENILLAMVSHLKGSWMLQAELRESGSGGLVEPVAADKLASLPALSAEPKLPPKRAAAGGLAFPEGIEWQLVFEDNFEREEVGKLWKPIQGTWRIAAGTLATDATGLIGYAKRLRAPVRIEYDARSDTPGDLTALWLRHGETWAGGYFIGFGSNGNTLNKLLRNGEQVATSERPLITPRKWHHVVAQVLPRGVMLVVDGQVAIRYRDPSVLRDPDTAGVCAWSAGRFDNVRIYAAK